jgi:hypothetical protein
MRPQTLILDLKQLVLKEAALQHSKFQMPHATCHSDFHVSRRTGPHIPTYGIMQIISYGVPSPVQVSVSLTLDPKKLEHKEADLDSLRRELGGNMAQV